MIVIRFGTWTSSGGSLFHYQRIFWRDYKWTPFCWVTWRYKGFGNNVDLREQIDRLADFIIKEVPGEPSENEGAIDTAIRVIRNCQKNGS